MEKSDQVCSSVNGEFRKRRRVLKRWQAFHLVPASCGDVTTGDAVTWKILGQPASRSDCGAVLYVQEQISVLSDYNFVSQSNLSVRTKSED